MVFYYPSILLTKKGSTMKHYLYLTLTILLLVGCSQKPQSDVDTPEYHFKAGMRAVETGEYNAALTSFQRSVDLDKKFALGYCGLGLANAHIGNVKEAKKNVGKGVGKGKKDPDVLALGARVWITLREHEKKWFKRASKLLDKALKRKKNHEASQYYYGVAHLYNYEFEDAGSYFRKVVDKKGDYAGKADAKWNLAQKIVRAMPGTPVGKKVALHEKVTRGDLAVLFAEELKISELFAKMPQQNGGFQTPGQSNANGNLAANPIDSHGHWAETWINEMNKYSILEVSPDRKFYPDEVISRAEYAMAVQRLLVVATRDAGLETRYFGESQSRFSDVPSSHFAYNAMALCSERGIMRADIITGNFNPAGPVTGADALLIIREIQSSLRMTF
jgi:tetratricopeptide (TPR) repeat protein